SLPSSLQRSATYYVAAGSYPSHTFADADSGTSLITVKKATATDHGTSTGWQSSYGTGQAAFTAPLQFSSDNYVVDGQYRTDIRSGHGFYVDNSIVKVQNGCIQLGDSSVPTYAHNIT